MTKVYPQKWSADPMNAEKESLRDSRITGILAIKNVLFHREASGPREETHCWGEYISHF